MQVFMKYPKTQHILGSKECDVDACPKKFEFHYPELEKKINIVIEEKMDGMGIGIMYQEEFFVQFRNHVFTQYDCPKNFDNIFVWINNQPELAQLLHGRIMFGEWMEYKHCVYYDALASYFIEYDIFDINEKMFLDAYNLKNPHITSARVVHQGQPFNHKELSHLLGIKTAFGKSPSCSTQFLKNHSHLAPHTLYDIYPEGFYIKEEKNGIVANRYKFIRKSFMQKVLGSKHWENSNPLKNQLIL